jgi:hypothetical protein
MLFCQEGEAGKENPDVKPSQSGGFINDPKVGIRDQHTVLLLFHTYIGLIGVNQQQVERDNGKKSGKYERIQESRNMRDQ